MPRKVRGRCYGVQAADGTYEITIALDRDFELHALLGTVVHESIHASGLMNHGPAFAKAGRDMGLSGKPTSMGYGAADDVPAAITAAAAAAGDFPGARHVKPAGKSKSDRGDVQDLQPVQALGPEKPL